MKSSLDLPIMYTPEQVAKIMQLSKNMVYQLIKSGDIPAKRFGRVYRIPQSAIDFVFPQVDPDIATKEAADLENLKPIRQSLDQARKQVWQEKSQSSR